eukprot:13763-Eustigmatos_ZCMA.PRE.1
MPSHSQPRALMTPTTASTSTAVGVRVRAQVREGPQGRAARPCAGFAGVQCRRVPPRAQRADVHTRWHRGVAADQPPQPLPVDVAAD